VSLDDEGKHTFLNINIGGRQLVCFNVHESSALPKRFLAVLVVASKSCA